MQSTHIDANGNAAMVDVSAKAPTARSATAEGKILLAPEALRAVRKGAAAKGDVLGVAQIAGIMGAKRASELIPLCHQLSLAHCSVVFELEDDGIRAVCTAKAADRTGVEMEALTAVTVACLTIIDMTKALDPAATIEAVQVQSKTGGKSGDWHR